VCCKLSFAELRTANTQGCSDGIEGVLSLDRSPDKAKGRKNIHVIKDESEQTKAAWEEELKTRKAKKSRRLAREAAAVGSVLLPSWMVHPLPCCEAEAASNTSHLSQDRFACPALVRAICCNCC
jgi:hypothetical protein